MTRVVAIVGPTAVGKSTTGLAVAAGLNAEIVSADSMQIYKHMDIGTDKPTPEMRSSVPHHLVDLKEPSQDLTVAEYQSLARAAIDGISARALTPLLVGGSGLYFRAIVDDLKFPPRAPEVRARLEDEIEALGPEALHARLEELDPPAAERIEPGNARRIVRALEVIEVTGERFSQSDWDRYESRYDLHIVGLKRERTDLYARIDDRVASMLERGLIEEARSVAAKGMSRTARQALGYRQILESSPETDRGELHALITRATKRFARRQESWFRADPRVTWLDADREDLTEALVRAVGRPAALP